MCSGGSSLQYLGARSPVQWLAWAYNEGLGAEPPGGQGKSPPEAEALFGFWTFNGSCKFGRFSKIWKGKKKSKICAVSYTHLTLPTNREV